MHVSESQDTQPARRWLAKVLFLMMGQRIVTKTGRKICDKMRSQEAVDV